MPCSPGMTKCKRDCLHRQMVREYQAARHAAEIKREEVCIGYATETALYGPIITFKDWLKALGR